MDRRAARTEGRGRVVTFRNAGHGVVGDRYESSRSGPRQVTLIASEDIAAITAFLCLPEIAPELLRRNIVTDPFIGSAIA
jgi:MOSC domain-containing protein YiiM